MGMNIFRNKQKEYDFMLTEMLNRRIDAAEKETQILFAALKNACGHIQRLSPDPEISDPHYHIELIRKNVCFVSWFPEDESKKQAGGG
jgi:hypothetical protein